MEQLTFIGTGFAIVMGILGLLWLGSVVISIGVKSFVPDASVQKAAVQTPDTPVVGEGAISPQHVAAIAGAVASLSKEYRVVRIDAPAHMPGAWMAQDRLGNHFIARNSAQLPLPGARDARQPFLTRSQGDE